MNREILQTLWRSYGKKEMVSVRGERVGGDRVAIGDARRRQLTQRWSRFSRQKQVTNNAYIVQLAEHPVSAYKGGKPDIERRHRARARRSTRTAPRSSVTWPS